MTGDPPPAPWPDGARAILHVDMDAFFVAVELLRRPELRGRPVVVGGAGPRGVVAAASYEARAYGVHSAMPSQRAQRLCPHAVFLPGDHASYAAVSRRVMGLFAEVTPLVEPLSLDEAFLDVTGARRLHGHPLAIARQLRTTVHEGEHLTCSMGLAPNKFLAKLASQEAKPRPSPEGPLPGPGVTVVWPGAEQAFLDPLPVRRLWGVGPATLDRLRRLGVETVADLARLPLEVLVHAVGEAHGRHLHDLARGHDERAVQPDRAPKSVGHEETFAEDLYDRARIDHEAARMADAVAARLRAASLEGRTVTVKVRFPDFRTITRSATLPSATAGRQEVTAAAKRLLAEVDVAAGVRLLGVSVSNLIRGAAHQLTLDLDLGVDAGDRPGSGAEVDAALDGIRSRFGDDAIAPASTLGPTGLRPKRRGDQQWGPPAPEG